MAELIKTTCLVIFRLQYQINRIFQTFEQLLSPTPTCCCRWDKAMLLCRRKSSPGGGGEDLLISESRADFSPGTRWAGHQQCGFYVLKKTWIWGARSDGAKSFLRCYCKREKWKCPAQMSSLKHIVSQNPKPHRRNSLKIISCWCQAENFKKLRA